MHIAIHTKSKSKSQTQIQAGCKRKIVYSSGGIYKQSSHIVSAHFFSYF